MNRNNFNFTMFFGGLVIKESKCVEYIFKFQYLNIYSWEG